MTSDSNHPEAGPAEPIGTPSAVPDAAAPASEATVSAPAPAEAESAPGATDASPVGEHGSGASGQSSSEETAAAEDEIAAEEFDDEEPEEEVDMGPVEPLELIEEPSVTDIEKKWYILKVQVNREDSIREALLRKIRIAGMEAYFGELIVPTEDVAEFNKAGKRRIVKKKLYPGYLLVSMALTDDSWFLVRETPGIGDFTGSAGKPSPMAQSDVEKILRVVKPNDEAVGTVRTAIPFKPGDRVRVKEGYFQNFEGEVSAIDQAHGRVTVMINIFGRPNPVELDHWQIEAV